jgi:hypothetical protein
MFETAFNLRSFVENQVERLSSPKSVLVDKFRQTVDHMRLPFTLFDQGNVNDYTMSSSSTSNIAFEVLPSSPLSNMHPSATMATHPVSNMNLSVDHCQRRQSTLRRHVSESSKSSNEQYLTRSMFHTNPSIDVEILLNSDKNRKPSIIDRSRSLLRQSTDTTCTFPIRRSIRRLESIEIPGLNGVKAIRYINDDLGRLQPELYKKPILNHDPTYNSGRITLTLFYNQSLASLMVTIISMDNLPYRDNQGKTLPNPFIKLNLLPDRRKKFQTKVYKQCQSIQCQEIFQFPLVYEQLYKRSLLLSVYDFSRSSKRNSIGTVKIDDLDSLTDLTSADVFCTRNIIPGIEVNLFELFNNGQLSCNRFIIVSIVCHFYEAS